MYSTPTELHAIIDAELEHISSNRKQSIKPEMIDWFLNGSVLQYIENKSNPKTNLKREGFEDSQKRYDDLRELKRVLNVTSCYNDSTSMFANLPYNYYKLICADIDTYYNRINNPYITSNVGIVQYQYIKTLFFPDDSNNPAYANFNIQITTYNTITATSTTYIIPFSNNGDGYVNYTIYSGITSGATPLNSKFIIVNYIVDKVNRLNLGATIYWEKYDNIYIPNTFIIVSPNTIQTNPIIQYGTPAITVSTGTNYNTSGVIQYTSYFYNQGNPKYNPLIPDVVNTYSKDLISSADDQEALTNYYYSRNRHRKPLCTIVQNRLIIFTNPTFTTGNVKFQYIKYPTPINVFAGTMCEISVTREIIDLTIERIKAFIKDEGYQQMVRENTINE
jgi:hypothetical protein